MTPVEPLLHEGAELIMLGANQPQYTPLPASIDDDGVVMTEWSPTAEELEMLLQGGRVRLWTRTFKLPFQPVSLEVTEPECGMRGQS